MCFCVTRARAGSTERAKGMNKKHKDILVTQRANLVENINMRDGLFTQLISRKVLNQRMVRSIQHGKSLDQQTEELLNILPTRGTQAFHLFCEALIADFQEEVVNIYLKSDDGDTQQEEVHCPSKVEISKESEGKSVIPSGSSNVVNSQNCIATVHPAQELESNRDGDNYCSSVSIVPSTIAVRGEFQQQIYRRNIEPSCEYSQQPRDSLLNEQEARLLYQNTLLHPDLARASLNPDLLRNNEKEKYQSCFNPSVRNSYLVNDCSEKVSFCQSSMFYPEQMIPEKFPSTRQSFFGNPIQESVKNACIFNSGDQVYSSYHNNIKVGNSLTKSHSDNFLFSTDHIHSKKSQLLPGNIECRSSLTSDGRLHPSMSFSSVSELHAEPSKCPVSPAVSRHTSFHQVLERDSFEMPRYIEVNSSDGVRNMVTHPSHIEVVNKLISNRDSDEHNFKCLADLQNDVTRKQNYKILKLARNDSVDTMHNRPGEYRSDISAKRVHEDVDNGIVQNVMAAEFAPVVKVLKRTENQIISVPVNEDAKPQPVHPAVILKTDSNVENSLRSSRISVMDDPAIDLTDGPVHVEVEHCTRQFYLANYKQSYAMRRIPRGKALILNVNEVVGKSPRRGTDIDRDNLHNLLCQLHFDVTVSNDVDGLTAMEMVCKLRDFSQNPGHRDGDCAIICILSHGEEGYIFGSDGKKFELEAVFTLFDNTCCPDLRGKPKIFIIQACRGGALDRGVQYYPDEHDGSDPRKRQMPSLSDMLLCYPTQNGYYAWRNRDRGSWYVEALVQVFMKYAKCEDLCTMLNRVNLLVSRKVSHCPSIEMDQMSQMSEYKSTLRMPHLYFFPGIGGT